jgi:hypothetical protein
MLYKMSDLQKRILNILKEQAHKDRVEGRTPANYTGVAGSMARNKGGFGVSFPVVDGYKPDTKIKPVRGGCAMCKKYKTEYNGEPEDMGDGVDEVLENVAHHNLDGGKMITGMSKTSDNWGFGLQAPKKKAPKKKVSGMVGGMRLKWDDMVNVGYSEKDAKKFIKDKNSDKGLGQNFIISLLPKLIQYLVGNGFDENDVMDAVKMHGAGLFDFIPVVGHALSALTGVGLQGKGLFDFIPFVGTTLSNLTGVGMVGGKRMGNPKAMKALEAYRWAIYKLKQKGYSHKDAQNVMKQFKLSGGSIWDVVGDVAKGTLSVLPFIL